MRGVIAKLKAAEAAATIVAPEDTGIAHAVEYLKFENAAFIALVRNAFPALLAVVEAASDLGLGLHAPDGDDRHCDMYSLRNEEVRALFAALAALKAEVMK